MIFAAYLVYRREKRKLTYQIKRYFNAPDDKTPSQFALMVDAVAFVVAQRFVSQLKATVAGMNSVDARLDLKEKRSEILEGNPQLASILNLIPGLRRILKSPAGLALAGQILSRVTGGNGSKAAVPGDAGYDLPFDPKQSHFQL